MPSKNAKKAAGLTRKQRRHLRRDQVQTRWVWFAGAAILALVLGVIAYGLYNTYVVRVKDPAATVYGNVITIGKVQKEVKFERMQWVETYHNLVLFSQTTSDLTTAQTYLGQAREIGSYLDNKEAIGDDSLQFLIEGEIARHEAELREITVSEDEITARVESDLFYIPEGTLTARPSVTWTVPYTMTYTVTPSMTITPGGVTLTPTTTFTSTMTPTATITGTVTATRRPTRTPTMTPLPTATVFTTDAYQKYYISYIRQITQKTGMSEQEYRDRVRMVLFIEKVRNAVMDEVPSTETQVHLAWIQLDDQTSAQAAYDRLVSGEDWNELAKAVSIDAETKDTGGDLGWISRGTLSDQMEDLAFTLNVGELTTPVPNGDGTWILLKVLERADRPIDAEQYQASQRDYYNKWLGDIKENTELVVVKGIPSDLIPSEPKV
jgi:parvulin-like peptidyl-prolyl isomerase